MKANKELKRPQYLFEKDVDFLKTEMSEGRKAGKYKDWTIADMVRLCVEYSRAHGVFAV